MIAFIPSKAANRKQSSGSADTSPSQALVDWMAYKALPLWASHDDPSRFPFVESLTQDGFMSKTRHVRLRVMARQVIVYSQAAIAGLPGALEKATKGWDTLERAYWSITTGWTECVVPPRKAVDTRFSLYNQAFAVYAAASWAEASYKSEPLAIARRTITLIDRRLKKDQPLGWCSHELANARDQNSHMHYLEALLAIHKFAPSHPVQSRIAELLLILKRHLLQPNGAIVESFSADWTFDPDQEHAEPGHLYEWYSLIKEARAQGFDPDVDENSLVSFADEHGWNGQTLLIYNSCNPSGKPKDRSHRLWPHCEALRAVCLHPHVDKARADLIAARILEIFLNPAPQGAWIDRVSDGLAPVEQDIPASSLYHLWGAANALVKAELASWPEDALC